MMNIMSGETGQLHLKKGLRKTIFQQYAHRAVPQRYRPGKPNDSTVVDFSGLKIKRFANAASEFARNVRLLHDSKTLLSRFAQEGNVRAVTRGKNNRDTGP